MPKKIIALAASDFHIHKFRNFNTGNSRLKNCVRVLKVLSKRCHSLGVPLLFAGDWYHTPDHVENETHSMAMNTYDRYFEQRGINVYAISGNHDMNQRNGVDHRSPSHLEAYQIFKTFHLIDCKVSVTDDFIIQGIPYMNNDQDLKHWINLHSANKGLLKKDRPSILLVHTDLPGAKTPEGFEVRETEHIPQDLSIFKPFTLVIAGHIHKPQILGTNAIMCGSPIHQNLGDEGIDMGYWEVWDDGYDLTVKFVPLKKFPQFKRGADNGDGNFWVQQEVALVDEEIELGEFAINKTRKKLASLYLKRKGIVSPAKRRALIQVLNQAE